MYAKLGYASGQWSKNPGETVHTWVLVIRECGVVHVIIVRLRNSDFRQHQQVQYHDILL